MTVQEITTNGVARLSSHVGTCVCVCVCVLQMAMLAGADESLSDVAFQYGRNVGLAFQLVDDLLDFVSSSAAMGKPTAADLKLGLATAPVLFACERVRKLNGDEDNNSLKIKSNTNYT